MNCESSTGWISSRTVFLVLHCHFFSKPTTQNNKNHYNTPIMMKTTSSATTSHATPVKANTGKSVVKNKILRIGEEPPVTALKQSSPGSVLTATTASSISLNQESSPASLLTASTAMTASSISSSQSTMTTSSKQSNSPNLARALDFGYLPVHANKERTSLTFAILLMSRANALSTYLVQVISLSVKKAN
jgi:hypothetical protein